MKGPIEIRRANKQLLGKMHHDHQYLKSLLENPLLTKEYNSCAALNVIPKKVIAKPLVCADFRPHPHTHRTHFRNVRRMHSHPTF